MHALKRYLYSDIGEVNFLDIDIVPASNPMHLHNSRFVQYMKRYKVAAVMFEHRPLKELVYVLRHYHEVLPNDITIHIFHGTSNRQNLPDIESYEAHHGKKREIIYTNTGLGNITREFYNLHMKNISFWRSDLVNYDYVLLFQADTVLCEQNRFKNGEYIATLFDYDYIGAPWLDAGMTWNSKGRKLHPKRPKGFPCACLQDRTLPRLYTVVGNGGLSWRNRRAMVSVIEKFKNAEKPFNEDLWFACGIKALDNYTIANESIAARFAIETVDDSRRLDMPPFGLHKTWHYVDNLGHKLAGYKRCRALQGLLGIIHTNESRKGKSDL